MISCKKSAMPCSRRTNRHRSSPRKRGPGGLVRATLDSRRRGNDRSLPPARCPGGALLDWRQRRQGRGHDLLALLHLDQKALPIEIALVVEMHVEEHARIVLH